MNFRGLPSVAAALAVAWAGGAASAATGPYAPGTLDDRIDLLVRSGFDRPVEAVAALSELRASSLPSPTLTRDIDLARGLVEAQAGHSQVAGVLAAHLESLSQSRSDPLATAAAELVRAAVADNAGRLDEAATRAQAAASSLERGCPRSRLGGSDDATRAAFAASCDYRSLWAALDVLQRRAMNAGQFQAARDHAQAALDLAEWAADGYRQDRKSVV